MTGATGAEIILLVLVVVAILAAAVAGILVMLGWTPTVGVGS